MYWCTVDWKQKERKKPVPSPQAVCRALLKKLKSKIADCKHSTWSQKNIWKFSVVQFLPSIYTFPVKKAAWLVWKMRRGPQSDGCLASHTESTQSSIPGFQLLIESIRGKTPYKLFACVCVKRNSEQSSIEEKGSIVLIARYNQIFIDH